jgi:predicted nucleic acid-binding Zn ribbon protein
MPVSVMVEEALQRYGVAKDVREHRIVTAWRELMGDKASERAWPESLKDGVLRVRVVNSSWLHELSLLRQTVLAKITALVGEPPLVKDVRFYVGGRTPEADVDDVVAALARRRRRETRTPRAEKPVPPALARQIDAETATVTDPELRALLASLRRRLGT